MNFCLNESNNFRRFEAAMVVLGAFGPCLFGVRFVRTGKPECFFRSALSSNSWRSCPGAANAKWTGSAHPPVHGPADWANHLDNDRCDSFNPVGRIHRPGHFHKQMPGSFSRRINIGRFSRHTVSRISGSMESTNHRGQSWFRFGLLAFHQNPANTGTTEQP